MSFQRRPELDELIATRRRYVSSGSVCRVCGCTDANGCVFNVRTGDLLAWPSNEEEAAVWHLQKGDDEFDCCYWVEPDLCSACVANPPPPLLYGPDGRPLRGAP